MHEIQTIVNLPVIAVYVSQSVCLSRGLTRIHCAKKAEQIKILFGVNNLGCPRNIVLDGGPDPPQRAMGEGLRQTTLAFCLQPMSTNYA